MLVIVGTVESETHADDENKEDQGHDDEGAFDFVHDSSIAYFCQLSQAKIPGF